MNRSASLIALATALLLGTANAADKKPHPTPHPVPQVALVHSQSNGQTAKTASTPQAQTTQKLTSAQAVDGPDGTQPTPTTCTTPCGTCTNTCGACNNTCGACNKTGSTPTTAPPTTTPSNLKSGNNVSSNPPSGQTQNGTWVRVGQWPSIDHADQVANEYRKQGYNAKIAYLGALYPEGTGADSRSYGVDVWK